jgi:hypothetical protein
MSLHLSTITPIMYSIAKDIYTLDDTWYLAGGTALALHIGHRESIDLDYFTSETFGTDQLKQQLGVLWHNRVWQVVYEAPQTLWCVVDGVKVSFIKRETPLLESPETSDSFRLASVSDIVVMKLLAICSREEYKDYFDLACISTMTDVRQWVHWWHTSYATQDMVSWLIALSQVSQIKIIPLEIHEKFKSISPLVQLPKVVREIQAFIEKTA